MNSGDTLGGRYRLTDRIAGGGMGEVWTAEDSVLDRIVAVKVIRRELAEDPEFAKRFHQEARTAAKLSHSNIAQVYDFGREESTDYLVMEFVRGTSLADLIDRIGPLPVEQAVSIITQAAAGLEAAHEAGVIHRDVKPANILVTEKGTVKITDFGIARALGAAKMTRTGEVMGTAQYLPPEAALGRDLNGQADLYSLAVVAYEALAGRRPFNADSAVTLAMKHVNEPPPPLQGNIPPGVRDAVMHGLAKDPNQRPRGVDGFGREIRAALTSTPARFPVQPNAQQHPGPISGPHAAGANSGPNRPISGPNGGYPQRPHYGQPNYGQPQYGQPQPMHAGQFGSMANRPASTAARAIGWTWLGLSVLGILTLFLPWASYNDSHWSAFKVNDAKILFQNTSNPTTFAALILIGFLVIGGLAIPQALGKGHFGFGVAGVVFCLGTTLWWLVMVAIIDGTTDEPSQLSMASGLWMCCLVGFATFVTVIASLIKRR